MARGSKHHAVPRITGRPDQEGLPKDRPRGILRKIISGALSYGVILIIFGSLLSKLTSESGSGTDIAPITAAQVLVVTVLGLVNLGTNLPPLAITLRGLRYREAFTTNSASAALSNTVPEGGAVATGLNFAMLRSWGFTLDRITSSFLTTGIWTNLCRYSLLALGLLVITATDEVAAYVPIVAAVLTTLMVAAIVLLVLALHRPSFAQRLGSVIGWLLKPVMRIIRKPPIEDMDERVDSFRSLVSATVGSRWRALTGTMMLSQFTAFFILGVALRMQGVDESTISWAHIVVAWGSMSLASLIVPTPGGLGVAEATLLAVPAPMCPTATTPTSCRPSCSSAAPRGSCPSPSGRSATFLAQDQAVAADRGGPLRRRRPRRHRRGGRARPGRQRPRGGSLTWPSDSRAAHPPRPSSSPTCCRWCRAPATTGSATPVTRSGSPSARRAASSPPVRPPSSSTGSSPASSTTPTTTVRHRRRAREPGPRRRGASSGRSTTAAAGRSTSASDRRTEAAVARAQRQLDDRARRAAGGHAGRRPRRRAERRGWTCTAPVDPPPRRARPRPTS